MNKLMTVSPLLFVTMNAFASSSSENNHVLVYAVIFVIAQVLTIVSIISLGIRAKKKEELKKKNHNEANTKEE